MVLAPAATAWSSVRGRRWEHCRWLRARPGRRGGLGGGRRWSGHSACSRPGRRPPVRSRNSVSTGAPDHDFGEPRWGLELAGYDGLAVVRRDRSGLPPGSRACPGFRSSRDSGSELLQRKRHGVTFARVPSPDLWTQTTTALMLAAQDRPGLHEREPEQVVAAPGGRVGGAWVVGGQADAPDPVGGAGFDEYPVGSAEQVRA
jgi:hypothetical protein